jgi:hypothetical protein
MKKSNLLEPTNFPAIQAKARAVPTVEEAATEVPLLRMPFSW